MPGHAIEETLIGKCHHGDLPNFVADEGVLTRSSLAYASDPVGIVLCCKGKLDVRRALSHGSDHFDFP